MRRSHLFAGLITHAIKHNMSAIASCLSALFIKTWRLLLMFFPLTTGLAASNFQMRGDLTLLVTPNPSLNQTMPFYFRWHDSRWMVCITNNNLFTNVHTVTCLASDGNSLIYYTQNKLSPSNPKVVPYQAELRPGSFPPYDNRYFGQLLAALAPTLLSTPDGKRVTCMLVYQNPKPLQRCIERYSVKESQPDSLTRILTIVTDGYGLVNNEREVRFAKPFENGYEILRLESHRNPKTPGAIDTFTIQYKYPDYSSTNNPTLQVVMEFRGRVNEYRELTEAFNGWPRIVGKTMVHDYRTPKDDLEFVHYVTTEDWMDQKSGQFLELRQIYAQSKKVHDDRHAGVLIILAVANLSALGMLLTAARRRKAQNVNL